MGTRSRIGFETGNGAVYSIYCHWDGYPAYVGATLNEHYRDEERVRALIDLGDLSSLREKLTADGPHSFASPAEGVCIAYGRDRGESDHEAMTHDSADDMFEHTADGWEEWAYVWRAGQWYCSPVGGGAGPFIVNGNDPAGTAAPEWLAVTDWIAIEAGERERPGAGGRYAATGQANPLIAVFTIDQNGQLRMI